MPLPWSNPSLCLSFYSRPSFPVPFPAVSVRAHLSPPAGVCFRSTTLPLPQFLSLCRRRSQPPFTHTSSPTGVFISAPVPVASGVVPFCALLVSLSPRPALFSPLSGPSCALLYQPAFLFASLFSCSHLFPWPSFLLAPSCSLAFCTSRRFFSRPSFPVRTSSLGRRFFSRPSVPLLSRPSRQV